MKIPEISREVLAEIDLEVSNGSYKPSPQDFVKEQPEFFKFLCETSYDKDDAARRFAAAEVLYEAIKRQMRRIS